MSYRTQDGQRRNARTGSRLQKGRKTPSQTQRENGAKGNPGYSPPKIANPGNIITCKVGGGNMGSKLAHENEAPFSEQLAEFFVRSFCAPGGVVLDPFAGSGTTLAMAEKWGRKWIGIDIRQSEVDLSEKRIAEQPVLSRGEHSRTSEAEGQAGQKSLFEAERRAIVNSQ